MKKISISLLLLAGLSMLAHGQNDISNGHIIKANSLSVELIGTPAWPIGVTYSQMLNNRLSFELGVGIGSAGARMDVYLSNPRIHRLNVYTGLSGSITYDAYPMVYVPLA